MKVLLYITTVCLALLSLPAQARQEAGRDFLVADLDWEALAAPDRQLVDSALSLFEACSTDTCRVDAVSLIVEGSWDIQVWPRYNEWVLEYTQRQIPAATDPKSLKALRKAYAEAINNVGFYYNSLGNADSALIYFAQGMTMQEELGDRPGLAGTLINIGYIYLSRGLIDQALDYYYRSLRIEEELNNQAGVARALNGIGFMQFRQGNNQLALDSYNQSLQLRESLGDDYGIATSLNNIGLLYKEQGEDIKALGYFKRTLALQQEQADKDGLSITYNNLADIALNLGNVREAKRYYEQSLELTRELKKKEGIAFTLNSLAGIALRQKKLVAARSLAEESFSLAQQMGYPTYLRDAAETLTAIAKAEGKWQEAMNYYELYVEMKDSIFNEETLTASIKQGYQYNYEKKALADSIRNADAREINMARLIASQAETDRISAIASNQRIQLYFLLFGIVSVLIVAGLIYNRMQAVRRHQGVIEAQNQQLVAQKKSIESQKEDLELLNQDLKQFARSISHDLKTPLSGIINVLYMIEAYYPNLEEELEEKLQMIQEGALRSMSMIDGILAYSKAGRNEIEKTHVDIGKLLEELRQQLPNENKVSIELEDDLPMVYGNPFQLSQVFSNLIGNALKYNHLPAGMGKIKVSSVRHAEHVAFTIADNGPGISPAQHEEVFQIFKTAHNGSQLDSTGIGLSIVKKLVTQNGGTINLSSVPGQGAAFTFTWPVAQKTPAPLVLS